MIIAGSCYDRPAVSVMNQMILKAGNMPGSYMGKQIPSTVLQSVRISYYLDGTWVLIVSYIYADGRKDGRDVVWYTGTYKDGKI